mmetsp:Transcript_8945/g.21985  ORF Transcript_8945/g.21985 Transcript_8945/m.21985 type:complete len:241 (-) Transcript_8945:495-1217(-)
MRSYSASARSGSPTLTQARMSAAYVYASHSSCDPSISSYTPKALRRASAASGATEAARPHAHTSALSRVASGAMRRWSISARRSKHRVSSRRTSSAVSATGRPNRTARGPAPSAGDAVSSNTRRLSASMSAPYVTTVAFTPSSSIRRKVSNALSSSPLLPHAYISVVYVWQSGATPASYMSTSTANPDRESFAAAHTDSSMLHRRTSATPMKATNSKATATAPRREHSRRNILCDTIPPV